jgi:hypothetical protein
MEAIECLCGATYRPKDAHAIARHEMTAKHLDNYPNRQEKDNVTDETTPDPYTDPEETFTDLDDPAPVEEKPKPKRKARLTVTGKACRVCTKVKPLEEFRRKASRPDGRDTICAACSKDWFIAHKAKKAGAK